MQLKEFSVFIDVERLEAGKFDNNLLNSIRQAKNFLLVLTPNALDRCIGDTECKDWVHRVCMSDNVYVKKSYLFYHPFSSLILCWLPLVWRFLMLVWFICTFSISVDLKEYKYFTCDGKKTDFEFSFRKSLQLSSLGVILFLSSTTSSGLTLKNSQKICVLCVTSMALGAFHWVFLQCGLMMKRWLCFKILVEYLL